jgi:3-deoxy-manno-octulosonate cytidylyltransferase (CMP-KDO synthetase)
MNIIAIIPARYHSTRFPGKPLCLIKGKPMIQVVYERVKEFLPEVVVATDHLFIKNTVESFGGNVVMTKSNHLNGTSRCYEAYRKIKKNNIDVVINIQGDEPLVHPAHFDLLIDSIKSSECDIATLAIAVKQQEKVSSDVFVVRDNKNYALYFSRYQLPFVRNSFEGLDFYKHMGIYAFKSQVFLDIQKTSSSKLERAEDLEQLRWLENGYKIKVATTSQPTFSVDTPEDLDQVNKIICF